MLYHDGTGYWQPHLRIEQIPNNNSNIDVVCLEVVDCTTKNFQALSISANRFPVKCVSVIAIYVLGVSDYSYFQDIVIAVLCGRSRSSEHI